MPLAAGDTRALLAGRARARRQRAREIEKKREGEGSLLLLGCGTRVVASLSESGINACVVVGGARVRVCRVCLCRGRGGASRARWEEMSSRRRRRRRPVAAASASGWTPGESRVTTRVDLFFLSLFATPSFLRGGNRLYRTPPCDGGLRAEPTISRVSDPTRAAIKRRRRHPGPQPAPAPAAEAAPVAARQSRRAAGCKPPGAAS